MTIDLILVRDDVVDQMQDPIDAVIDLEPSPRAAPYPALLAARCPLSAAGMASLTESFSRLGLDQSMVSKYVTVILDYAKSEGGQNVMNLLKGALL